MSQRVDLRAGAAGAAPIPVEGSLISGMARSIIRGNDADNLTGLSRSTRYRLENLGQFPARIKLSERASGYYLDEIQGWLASRPRANRNVA